MLQSPVESSSLRGISRIAQLAYGTVASTVRVASHKAQMVHNAQVLRVETNAVIADELWSFVQKNNSRDVVDTRQRLMFLPVVVISDSGLIAQSSCSPSYGKPVGSFQLIITGRGGLPPNPNDPLTGDNVLTDWNTLDSDAENRSSAEEGATNSTKESTPTQIVEANGWMTNDKGEVILTASAPTATLDIPWLPSSSCNAPEPKS